MAAMLIGDAVDLGVGFYLRRHHPVVVGEILHPACGLDDPVEHPLLIIAAAFGELGHGAFSGLIGGTFRRILRTGARASRGEVGSSCG